MNQQLLNEINNKIDFLIIGHNVTSYKNPSQVDCVKEYEGKICIEVKNIKNKYIVFDKDTLISAFKNYLKDNNNDNINKEEKT